MRSKKLIKLLTLTILIVSGQALKGQIPEDPSRRIRDAVEARDWQSARTQIERLASNDNSTFRAHGYDYLLARIAEEMNDFATATRSYQASASTNSPFSHYALWHLARIARASGDLVLEREYLRKLISVAPGSLLIEAASFRLAQSFFESGDYPAVVTSARQISLGKDVALARESSLLMGQAYLLDEKSTEARNVFNKLVMQMPDASKPDDFALAAVRELDQLDKKANTQAASLSDADHLLRASIYQFNRDFGGARVHYQAVVDSNNAAGTIPNALFQLGRGLYLEGRYDEAIKLFQRVADQFPQSQSARDATASLAASYLRLKQTDDAITTYKLFISRFPEAPNPERPYLNIIDALHEAGRYSEALNWVQQTRSRFPNQLGGTLALFAQQRIHLAQNAWANVVRDADDLLKFSDPGGTRVPGGTTSAEVLFLKAFALEQLGRTEDAVSAYLAIPDGRNEYYGMRATQRLLVMARTEKSRATVLNRLNSLSGIAQGEVSEQTRLAIQNALRLTDDTVRRADLLARLKRSYAALPGYKLNAFQVIPFTTETRPANASETIPASAHQAVGERLLELGLYDEAMPEIFAGQSDATRSMATNPQTQTFYDDPYTLAVFAVRAGLPYRAVRFGEQVWKTIPSDYMLEVAPPELVQLLYPPPFRESLLKHASPRNIDPRFILSIIRQESRYQAEVKSVSAARGMMQFIPATANEIAAQLKLKDFTQDDLYNADTAILFGSQYLANLFQQFPGQPQAVAGSYNGGADNLARWIARSRSNEADRYVPEIGFSQTKDYVYKVMSNYWNYQRLYDDQLRPLTK